MAPSSTGLSAPFAARDFNGETLLDEIASLAEGEVPKNELVECVLAVRGLAKRRSDDAAAEMKRLAAGRFRARAALSSLLAEWAGKVRTDADLAAMVSHFERLGLVSALAPAARRANERLAARGSGP